MLKELAGKEKVTGVKQSSRAVRSGLAREVFLANDADPALTAPLRRLCQERGIPVCEEFAMARLGEAAGIQVGAAVVTVVEKHR